MPRSNRPRGRKPSSEGDDSDLDRLRAGWHRTEEHRDGQWKVRPVTAAQAVKAYLCPGCSQEISPGIAHVVAWRGDGIMGDAADVAGRRHWHAHCWRIK